MAHSAGMAKTIQSVVHGLNPANYDAVSRKVKTLPVTTRSHLNDIATAIHVRALARPAHVKLYAALCADIITGGFDGARPGSGPAFRTSLLPKCYDKFKEACRNTATTRFQPFLANSERKTNLFVTNCLFIGELYKLGVYRGIIVWSFLNDLVNRYSCDVQARCLCALLTLVAPKLSETYTMTRHMSLKTKNTIDEIRRTYWTDRIREHPNTPAEQRPLANIECSFESSDNNLHTSECIHADSLEILLKTTNIQFPKETNYDIEPLLTTSLLSSLERDQASLIISLSRAAFANGEQKIRTVAGILLADLVNAGRLTKYAVVKGFHVMIKDKAINERYPNLPDLTQQIRNAFEDRLDEANPVNDTLYETNQTSLWLDCSSNKDMINMAFLELLEKFGSKINFKERHDTVNLVKLVLVCMLKYGQVNTAVSINYTAIHSKEETIRVNAGKLLARLVLAGRLRKTSVTKGFCKILIDEARSDYFTNIPELLATIRTAFENEL